MTPQLMPNLDPAATNTPPLPNVPPPATPTNVQGPPNPQIANAIHDSMIGRAFKVLSGQNTQYSVDPATGRTVQTQVPNTPGQFFKNLVASAIIGGATGAQNHTGSGLASAAMGGEAAINRDRQLDQERVQRAQQEYQNEQASQRNQREEAEAQRQAQAFQTTEQLRKAQIAASNMETLRLQTLIHNEDFNTHNDITKAGKAEAADFEKAGIQPIRDNLSESEYEDFIKNRPGAAALKHYATGTVLKKGPDGEPHWENTYSVYDPNAPIKVSKATLDQWKEDGLDKYHPEIFDAIKPNRELSTNEYLAVSKQAAQLRVDNMARQLQKLNVDKDEAEIARLRASTVHEQLESNRVRQEIEDNTLTKNEKNATEKAKQHLDQVNGDISKLLPSERLTLSNYASKILPAMNSAVKNALDAGDQDTAKDYMGQMNQIMRMTSGVFAPGADAQGTPMINPQGQTVLVPANQVDDMTKKGYKPVSSNVPPKPSTKLPSKKDLISGEKAAIGSLLGGTGGQGGNIGPTAGAVQALPTF